MHMPTHLTYREALRAFYISYLRQQMVRFDGNIVKMAKQSGVSREAITRQIKRYELRSELELARARKLQLREAA